MPSTHEAGDFPRTMASTQLRVRNYEKNGWKGGGLRNHCERKSPALHANVMKIATIKSCVFPTRPSKSVSFNHHHYHHHLSF